MTDWSSELRRAQTQRERDRIIDKQRREILEKAAREREEDMRSMEEYRRKYGD